MKIILILLATSAISLAGYPTITNSATDAKEAALDRKPGPGGPVKSSEQWQQDSDRLNQEILEYRIQKLEEAARQAPERDVREHR